MNIPDVHYVACWTENDGVYCCGHTHPGVREAMNCLVPDGRSFIRAYDAGVYRSLFRSFCERRERNALGPVNLARSTSLRADLHPATRSARRGPRACGARKVAVHALCGTTPLPSTRSAHLLQNAKVVP